MHLWCKTSQNIWPLFSKYLPLHHLTPEWWNGRHEGLKIPWPLRLYEFESRFRHFPSVELLSRREFFLLFLSPPYMYVGRYCPKEGKNNEKLTYYFVDVWKLICKPCKLSYVVFSYVCVRARTFQQRCCFFAVTSVTRREKSGQKTAGNSVKRKK